MGFRRTAALLRSTVVAGALVIALPARGLAQEAPDREDGVNLRLGTPPKCLPEGTWGVQATLDGKRLVGASFDGGLSVLDTANPANVLRHPANGDRDGGRLAVTVAPGARYACAFDAESERIVVRDVSTGAPVSSFGNDKVTVQNAWFTPDGSGVFVQAIVYDGTERVGALVIVDPATGKVVESVEGDVSLAQITVLSVSSDGRVFVIRGSDGTFIFDARGESGSKVSPIETTERGIAMLTPDGKRAVFSDAKRGMCIYDTKTLSQLHVVRDTGTADTFLLDEPRHSLVVKLRGAIASVDLLSGRERWRVPADVDWLTVASAAGRIVYGSSAGTIVEIDAKTGDRIGTANRHDAGVTGIARRADGSFVTLDRTGEWRTWDASGKTGTAHRAEAGYVARILSPDGTLLLARNSAGEAGLVDVATGKLRRGLGRIAGAWHTVGDFAGFDRTGRFVALIKPGNPLQVSCVEAASGRETLLHPVTGEVTLLDVSPRGDAVGVTKFMDRGRMYVVPKEGDEFVIATDARAAIATGAFSEDGSRVILVDDDGAIVDVPSDRPHNETVVAGFKLPDRPGMFPARFAFGPGDRLAVAPQKDGAVVHDLDGWAVLGSFSNGARRLTASAISSDGKTLLAGFEDGAAMVYDLASVKSMAERRRRIRASAPTEEKKDALGDSLPRGALARLGTARLRHAAAVGFATVTSSGFVVTGSSDGVVNAWDGQDGRLVRSWRFPGGPLIGVAALGGGARLVVAAAEGRTLCIVDATSGKETSPFDLGGARVADVAVHKDGKTVAVLTAEGDVQLFDTDTGASLGRADGARPKEDADGFGVARTSAVMFAGPHLVTLEHPRSVHVHDTRGSKRQRSLEAPERTIWERAVGATGSPRVFRTSAALDGVEGAVVDVSSGRELRKVPRVAVEFPAMAISSDGAVVAWIDEARNVCRMDVASGAETVLAAYPVVAPRAMAFSADGKRLVVGDASGRVRLLDAKDGKESVETEGHTGMVVAVAVSPDGRLVATGAMEGAVRISDVATGALIRALDVGAGMVSYVAWSADGKRLAVVSQEPDRSPGASPDMFGRLSMVQVARVIDAESGKEVASVPDDIARRAAGMAFVAGGDRILLWSERDRAPQLLDAKTCAVVGALPAVPGRRGVRVPRNGGNTVLLTGKDTVAAVDTATNKVVWTVSPEVGYIADGAALPGGRVLAHANSGAIFVVDAASSKVVTAIRGREDFWSFDTSPDGALLAVADKNGELIVFDVSSGGELKRFGDGHLIPRFVDDRRLLATRRDGTSLVFDVGFLR